jgi:hypothetical protein
MRSKRAGGGASMTRTRFRLLPLTAAIAFCCAGYANATTIAVNDTNDDSVPGKCTLADAVAAINTATAVNACAAGNGNNDTIDLSFFTSATTISFVNPTAADRLSAIALTKPATITGPVGTDGKPLVTIARDVDAIYFRVIATSADLTIQNTIVTGGYANVRGVGIYASGHANLTITNSVVSNNTISGPGVYSGGGIASQYGNITVSASTVSGNFANNNGGGIYTLHEGAITVSNSTISGNHADYSGGGIYSFNGNVTLNSSTISGNAVFKSYYYNGVFQPEGGFSGGGVNVYQTLRMTNSTVSGNYSRLGSAGVFVGGAFYGGRPAGRPHRARPAASPYLTGNAYLYFSTIAGNVGNDNFQLTSGFVGANYLKSVGTIVKDNQFGDMQLSFPGVVFAGSNNIIGSPPGQAPVDTRDCDPKLGPLANNGGPTLTRGLLDGSCAIDTGPAVLPDGISTDQRGLPRPVNVISDVGAFEKQGPNDGVPDLIFQDGFDT